MAIKEGVWGKWDLPAKTIFRAYKLDEDGTGNYFETSQTKTDTPTLYLDNIIASKRLGSLVSGHIQRIHYRLKPTGAVTYTLRIWEQALAPDYASNSNMLYESPTLQASDTDYDKAELNIPFHCANNSGLLYSIEWSGAEGNTMGFIEVSGEMEWDIDL